MEPERQTDRERDREGGGGGVRIMRRERERRAGQSSPHGANGTMGRGGGQRRERE